MCFFRYLNYGDEEWKKETKKVLAQLNTYTEDVIFKKKFQNI